MIIKGIDNQTVELKITNYQYPTSLDRDWDGNWLNIYLKVESKIGNWQTVDPSLLTWEVQTLIDWFNELSANKKPEYLEQVFIEPNISFHLLNSCSDLEKQIKIRFDLESRPKNADDEIEYYVILIANNAELKKLAENLENELKIYPERK